MTLAKPIVFQCGRARSHCACGLCARIWAHACVGQCSHDATILSRNLYISHCSPVYKSIKSLHITAHCSRAELSTSTTTTTPKSSPSTPRQHVPPLNPSHALTRACLSRMCVTAPRGTCSRMQLLACVASSSRAQTFAEQSTHIMRCGCGNGVRETANKVVHDGEPATTHLATQELHCHVFGTDARAERFLSAC